MRSLYYILIIVIINGFNLLLIQCKIVSSISNVTSNGTTETQYTNCRISTDKLIADASATVTRVLSGECNIKFIEDRLGGLENIIIDHFNEIKILIQQLMNFKNQFDIFDINKQKVDNTHNILNIVSPRQGEIDKFNDTITEINQSNERIYSYYWKVYNIQEKFFVWKTSAFERSNTFCVKNTGYAMFLKFTPKYFPDGTVFISVGLTKGYQDDQVQWPFPYKLQIEILDHSSESVRQDRKSRSWDPSTICPIYFWDRPKLNDNPECVGMSIPRYFLIHKYLWNDSLYIKLTVYL